MELRRIKYINIYGYLTGDLSFERGENFLVGINGCGKTTVLKLIRWILEPSLENLCTIEHNLISLEIKHGKYNYSIQSRILKNEHEFKVVTTDKSWDLKPIVTIIQVPPKDLKEDLKWEYSRAIKRRRLQRYREPQLTGILSLLGEIPSPIFVGLGRELPEEELQSSFGRRPRSIYRSEEDMTPIKKATEFMRDAFNTGKQSLVEINDNLNRKIIELSFGSIVSKKVFNQAIFKTTDKKIEEKITLLKNRIKYSDNKSISKALSSKDVRYKFIKYLNSLERLLKQKSKDSVLWVQLNKHNFDRISKMLDIFEEHELDINNALRMMNNFEEEVNRFLNDSGKQIHFDENTGSPYFTSSDFEEKLLLSELSSGESQIVVLLSYFAFHAKSGIPIVIDEPELSLHVEWQNHFVAAVKKVMPLECQTIMATHSPEICGASDVNVQAISVKGSK